MPELPDITVYLDALEERVLGESLTRTHLANPFLLRTATPELASFEGREVIGLARLGKRIVFEFSGERFMVFHLMIAGRLHSLPAWPKRPARRVAMLLQFGIILVILRAILVTRIGYVQ